MLRKYDDTNWNVTDWRTDGQTELLYQYRTSALLCWRAIKIKEFSGLNPGKTLNNLQAAALNFTWLSHCYPKLSAC